MTIARTLAGLALVTALTVLPFAAAGTGEVEVHAVFDRNPDWYYGSGASYLMTLRGNGFTSWGSFNYYLDVDFKPDRSTETDTLYLEVAPILSLSKTTGMTLPRWLTDLGLTVQYNHGLADSRYQLIPQAWLFGTVLSFGGGAIDVLDVHLLRKKFKTYHEEYEIPYIDYFGYPQLATVRDDWPYEDGWQVTVEWLKTWRAGKNEIFTRGFCDYWKQEWQVVEQWPDFYPGLMSKGPTWLAPGGEHKLICQPQVGYRFGMRGQYAVGTE
ncbi:MAG: hypothetical protein Q9Q13_11280, partial [Acidobacteriota bacterium]|nr:hypothetical protein [Acidobacteriota bacterium]